MNFTQVEPEYTYEIPSLQRDNSDEAIITAATALTLLVAVVIALVYWGVILWRLPSKAGYKGAAQWVWFLLLYFPLTLLPHSMINQELSRPSTLKRNNLPES